MAHDPEVTARIDHLLRTDARLSAAAPLIGLVPAIVNEPRLTRVRKSKSRRKHAPPRVDQHAPNVTEMTISPEALDEALSDGEDTAAAPPHAPWLKVAKLRRVPDALRTALGTEALAMVEIDGGLWLRLDEQGRDAALVLALRGAIHEEREDGSSKMRREVAPLQCHPDTAPELSYLVAALTDDPAAAARDSGVAETLVPPTEILVPSVVSLRPGEDGGYVATGPNGAISQGDTLAAALRGLAEAVEINDETPMLGSWASAKYPYETSTQWLDRMADEGDEEDGE